ncbi:MAG: class I adenylate-forming enzyme family protein [Alphaproteobacteria bacterium]
MLTNVVDAIGEQARRSPRTPAFVDARRRLDRAAADAAAGRAAAALAAAGISAGQMVAVVAAGDPVLHAVTVLALARLGATHLPLRADEPADALRAQARMLGATALVAEDDHTLGLPLVRPRMEWLEGGSDGGIPARDADDVPWIIAHSSGTTGAAKAIAVTHAMEIARNARDMQAFRHGDGEPWLTLIGPGFYNSTSAMIRCLAQGGTVVLDRSFRSVEGLIDTVERHDVGFLQLTPSHLFALVGALPEAGPRLPHLRVLRVSSAALPAATLAATRARLTDRVHLTYGTNEAGTIAVAGPEALAAEPAGVGRPLAGIDLELVGPDDRPVGPGETGMVRVRGPGVMAAYVGDPEATWRHCRDGWFLPGDLAVRAADGALRLKGRADRTMNIGGVLTAAEEIEAVMATHPAVVEAAVVPIPSERYQTVPMIVVVLRGQVDLEVLRDHVRGAFRGFPIALMRADALPRNAMGKIDYVRVAGLAAARRDSGRRG